MEAGRHLILDCILTDESIPIVSSTEKMAEYLEKVTDITGMTLVIPPISMKFPFSGETQRLIKRLEEEGTTSPIIEEFKQHIKHRDEDQGGVSAITVWLESHATLHSWPLDKYISIDLFSCKMFEYQEILDFTKDFMKLQELNVIVVDRMMDAPAKVKQFTMILQQFVNEISDNLKETYTRNTELQELFDKYVPATGKADTVGGELLRAINKLLYRYYNDGDVVGLDYGNETCNAPARFLETNTKLEPWVLKLWEYAADKKYESLLNRLAQKVIQVCKQDNLFEQANEEDMNDYDDPSDYTWAEEDEEEY